MIDPSTIVLLVGFTKSVASIFLGGSVGIALSLGIIRYQAHKNDEKRLKMAISFLEKHYQALAALDVDDTPIEALDLAIRLSNLIIDPRAPSAIAFVFSKNPHVFRDRRGENDASAALWSRIKSEARPELLEALAMSNMTGMGAFILRWPECKAAFEDVLINLAASPLRETEIVIRETKRAMAYQESPKTDR